MQFSIIVPVFNEAPLIQPFLRHLRERAPEAEIIVADGGSSDGTPELARDFCDQLVMSKPNRAVQMNLGARGASGDVLWFVHVDAEVPHKCLNEISRMLDDPTVVGGFFRIRLTARTSLSIDGQLCVLRRRFASNAVWGSRDILPTQCLP